MNINNCLHNFNFYKNSIFFNKVFLPHAITYYDQNDTILIYREIILSSINNNDFTTRYKIKPDILKILIQRYENTIYNLYNSEPPNILFNERIERLYCLLTYVACDKILMSVIHKTLNTYMTKYDNLLPYLSKNTQNIILSFKAIMSFYNKHHQIIKRFIITNIHKKRTLRNTTAINVLCNKHNLPLDITEHIIRFL